MIKLSPSALNLFLECPRCFWAERVRGIHRPNGPFPSLPGGIDSVLKKYFDKFREKDELPPEIEGKVEGKLLNDPVLQIWRQNLKGIRYYDKELDAELMGALDDCLIDGSDYIAVDYKTRGWLPKDDSHTYYQNQLNVYTLLLEKNGYKHKNFAYLVFYSPEEVLGQGTIKFNVEVRKVEVNPKVAYKVFEEAVEVLRGPQPPAHSDCQFCSWGNDYIILD
ncbi:MAG: PD-(D/E)XK nuclease family protein [Candidatus Colwellbacteria bacterium]|nr:PD-(D/E)XK nuclease family protein [Candidatus Colwellbacteria bacterium]